MPEIPVLEAAPGQVAPSPRKTALWVMMTSLLLVLVLGAGAVGAWYVITTTAEKKAAAPEQEKPVRPPLYVALDPPFVVNFEAEQLVRFLQVTVQVMSRDPHTVDVIKANDPVVRNDLLLLLGNQKYETLATREGKEKLRQQSLDVVRKVVKNAGGKPELVEAVYFTSFVMQ